MHEPAQQEASLSHTLVAIQSQIGLPAERFPHLIETHAPWLPVPLCPSLQAWMIDDPIPLWEALEAETGREEEPPMFAFAWPAAQALALLLATGAIDVRHKRVLDLGCGSGVAAAAAARAGAAEVILVDLAPMALLAASLLLDRHQITTPRRYWCGDAFDDGRIFADCDVVFAADLFYSRSHAERGPRCIRQLLGDGKEVYLTNAERPYFDACGLQPLWEGQVAVPRALEGVCQRHIVMWGLAPA